MKKIALLCLISFLTASPAYACRELNFKAAAEAADVIFIGTPQTITNFPPTPEGFIPSKTTFQLIQSLKGKLPPTVTVYLRADQCRDLPPFGTTAPSDKKYLVFAVKKDDHYEIFETFFSLPNMPSDEPEAQQFLDDLD